MAGDLVAELFVELELSLFPVFPAALAGLAGPERSTTPAEMEVSRGLQLQFPMENPYCSCKPTLVMAYSCNPFMENP